MPSYTYIGVEPRTYPAPPIVRELSPGEVVELDVDQVPDDGRFTPTPDLQAKPAKATSAKGTDA